MTVTISVAKDKASHDRMFVPRSVKEECPSKLVLFGERSLQRALTEFVAHYHAERNHQGKVNLLLFPSPLVAR